MIKRRDTSPQAGALRRSNLLVSLLFALLGVAVLVGSTRMPPGLGNLPGPGFFPRVLGALLLGFSLMLATERTQAKDAQDDQAQPGSAWPLVLAAMALLTVYLLSWEWLPFLVRTPLLIGSLMRLSGASWRSVAMGGVLLSLFLFGIFQLGLRVDLG